MKYDIVYLTEKDSQVQALAPVLGCVHTANWKPAYNQDGTIAIVPLQGHLLELPMPDYYDPTYKQWNEDTVFCFPKEFKKVPQARTLEMYKKALDHLRNAKKIVIATDYDNEGAALAMEVIEAAGVEDRVEYMLQMGSMNPDALRQALEEKTPIPYRAMANAGYARSYIDWADGMSLSRASTVYLGKKRVVLEFGGVKTPIIDMVVKRDLQFESHTSVKFWTINGNANVNDKDFKISIYKKVEVDKKTVKETKFDSEAEAKKIAENLINTPFTIAAYSSKEAKENPKTMFTQTELQSIVSAKYGLDPIQTLEICQKLYIDHKILTYPRTDIEYLHEKEIADVPVILNLVKSLSRPDIIDEILSKPILKRSTVFDSSKVTSHGAIVPTTNKDLPQIYNRLTQMEKNVFNLVMDRYIENFLEAATYTDISGEINLGDDIYASFSEKYLINPGYKIYSKPDILEDIKNYETKLPKMKKGDSGIIKNTATEEGQTKPKGRFTMDELSSYLEKVHRAYPEEPYIKEILGENGIGTSSTRAVILSKLFLPDKDGTPWLEKKGGKIVSTEKARKFIKALPDHISSPIRRAKMQAQIRKIERNELTVEEFLEENRALIKTNIEEIIEFSKNPDNVFAPQKKEVTSLGKCPICKDGDIYESASGKLYMCTSAQWTNEGTKEAPAWKNNGCNYKIMKNGLDRFGKATIGLLEVKKLLEKGSFKAKLKSKNGADYEKDITVDEKYGIKVNF